jgi:carbonic anhydrase/acetyltransferase-like protein (isoleucine patch superfamily)
MSKNVLFGTGRGASVAHRFLAGDSTHEVVAFTVDAPHVGDGTYRGLPVVPFEEVERHYPPDGFRMLIFLGYQQLNGLRKDRFDSAKAKGYTLESYVASDIFRVEPIKVGENCFIMDNQSISLDVSIGNNVVMWSSNHVGDLTQIGDHAWLTSHVTIAANVTVGERSFIGLGAAISNGVVVGREAFVGSGAQISTNVADGTVRLAGHDDPLDVPARAFMRVMMSKGKL